MDMLTGGNDLREKREKLGQPKPGALDLTALITGQEGVNRVTPMEPRGGQTIDLKKLFGLGQ